MSSMGGDDLTIHAELDNDVSPELREIREDLNRVGNQAQTTGRQASRSARGFDVLRRAGNLAATGVKLAFVGALGAGYAAVRLLGASFTEAREAQKVGATTTAIIKSTGGAAKVTEKHVGRLAERLSVMAGVDDELIQTGANLLLTFKQVRNEAGKGNKVFDRATTAALDLSAAGFGSIDSASKMLGKALNDPLKGITALSRAGVTFTQGQQDTIKSLVEQGDLLTAQKIILGEVESQVGGVAKAQATWADKARVYGANILESLGTALLPVLDDVARWFVRVGGPALDGYVRTFRREGVPAIREFVDEAKPVATKWLPKIADTLGDVADVTQTAAGYAGDLIGAFLNAPPWVRKALVGGGIAAGLGAKLNLGSLLGSSKAGGSGLLGLVSKAKPLPVFVVNNGVGGDLPIPGGGKPPGSVKGGGWKGYAASLGAPLLPALGAVGADDPASYGPDFKNLTKFDPLNKSLAAINRTLNENWDADLDTLLLTPLRDADAHTKTLGKNLDKVKGTKVDPTFTTPGLDVSQRVLRKYGDTLLTVKEPVTTKVYADTSSAQQTVNAFLATARAALANLAPGGPSVAAPAPTGKGGRHRQPDPVATPTPRTSARGGGGVTVHPGGIHVDARGATATVDVEQAVLDALERYERDQYERGNG